MTEITNEEELSHFFWGTADEIRFIDELGSRSYKMRNDPCLPDNKAYPDRRAMLEGYLLGSSQRDRWGSLNKKLVMRHALDALRKMDETLWDALKVKLDAVVEEEAHDEQ